MLNESERDIIKEALSFQVTRLDRKLLIISHERLKEHVRTNLINTLTLLQKINKPLSDTGDWIDGTIILKAKIKALMVEHTKDISLDFIDDVNKLFKYTTPGRHI